MSFLCVSCCKPTESLTKSYDLLVVLDRCPECHALLDPYVEKELTLKIVDFLLQRDTLYRHVLYNEESRQHTWSLFKLVILLLAVACHVQFPLDVYSGVNELLSRSIFVLVLMIGMFYVYTTRAHTVIRAALLSQLGLGFFLISMVWGEEQDDLIHLVIVELFLLLGAYKSVCAVQDGTLSNQTAACGYIVMSALTMRAAFIFATNKSIPSLT